MKFYAASKNRGVYIKKKSKPIPEGKVEVAEVVVKVYSAESEIWVCLPFLVCSNCRAAENRTEQLIVLKLVVWQSSSVPGK